jgi:hypothetical protein
MIGRFTSDRCTAIVLICGSALLFTGLNALKPVHMDDTAYYYLARQIAAHPLDPYGGTIFWYHQPRPANHVLVPPLLPYWWSIALRLFGEQPVMWKLWLLPFSVLFAGSMYWLARRFARGLEIPLVLMTVGAPAFLPSINLMLDVPALSLSLFALALFVKACSSTDPRPSALLVVLAGLAAGLAMQTKYTGVLAPATILAYAVLFGWLRQGFVAAGIATMVFVGWESWIAATYGESHFLYHLQENQKPLIFKFRLILPLIALLGGVAWGVTLLGWVAQGMGRRALGAGVLAAIIAYGLLAVVPEDEAIFTRDPVNQQQRLTLNGLAFGSLGLLTAGTIGWTAVRLCSRMRPPWTSGLRSIDREVWFLVVWLLLEIAGYFALTPFAAVRRVLGVVVVGTLLTGRLASRTVRITRGRRLVWAVAAFNVLFGFLYFGVDLRDAGAEKEAVERASAWIEQQPSCGGRVWFVGHWGLQYYAERAGMQPVVPDESHLHAGDWLVVPHKRLSQQAILLDERCLALAQEFPVQDRLPWRTVMCYYSGNAPIEHQEGPRVRLQIHRVQTGFVPSLTAP